MKAAYSRSSNDMFWSIYDWNPKTMEGETIRWSGYDDDFWWNKISVTDQFQVRVSVKTGRVYRLNPETGEVTITEAAEGE